MSKLSNLSETLIGSEIVKLGNEINELIRNGRNIKNLTIGDFKSSVFPLPQELQQYIKEAYDQGYTNYPPAEGALVLREAVSAWLKKYENLDYTIQEIQIASGGRPLIYSIYRAIVDKGDKVIYPVPSWNNNHYTHFNEGNHITLHTTPENNFMPTAAEIQPHLNGATLLSLCSPLNPTGTTFRQDELEKICDLVLEENSSRGVNDKKLYIMYDQIYWTLTHGSTQHFNPVSLRPALKDYTIFVDGISKSFAATGVRVGWSMGPAHVIAKIKAILSHVGAWAPLAEQIATAQFLNNSSAFESYMQHINAGVDARLQGFYKGFQDLKQKGYNVDAIAPEAAIYLTVKIDIKGKTTASGQILHTQHDVWQYILNEANVALVPFSSFGAGKEDPWYRLSVGTCAIDDIAIIIGNIEKALSPLS